MKKMIVSLLTLSLTWVSFTVVAFDRAQLEKEMYARSRGLLPEGEYKKISKPFLDKAEEELKAVQFCQKNQNCVECDNYFAALLNYNVGCFLNHTQNNQGTESSFENQRARLKISIKALAQKGALQRNEVETELQKTERLVLDGNKAFVSAYSIIRK